MHWQVYTTVTGLSLLNSGGIFPPPTLIFEGGGGGVGAEGAAEMIPSVKFLLILLMKVSSIRTSLC